MRRSLSLLAFGALAGSFIACTGEPVLDAGAQVAQPFSSEHAVLLDFELDGRIVLDEASAADPTRSIEAQLLFAVGPLNEDRAVGRYERLAISRIVSRPIDSRSVLVAYHAVLPVAWASPTVPSSYQLTVPARISKVAQRSFVERYATTCVDPAVGDVSPGNMFLAYRPRRAGCELAPADVMVTTAIVRPSVENTTDHYPEYDRIWDDGALEVVALFSRESRTPTSGDAGRGAYDAFLARANDFLRSAQPDDRQRRATTVSNDSAERASLGASLPDGRAVQIDAALVAARLSDEGASFDRWYDAATPSADLILYNGHAGFGANVHSLMAKGQFRTGQYTVLSINGCNTLAYIDRSLADRRRELNPDDPNGTKYMDVVSNVLAGYFATGPDTSMAFIEAVLGARGPGAPRSYREIFATIDPLQVIVVTGEEDNAYRPTRDSPPAPLPAASDGLVAPPIALTSPAGPTEMDEPAACDLSPDRRARGAAAPALLVLVLACAMRRRRTARDRECGGGAPPGPCPASDQQHERKDERAKCIHCVRARRL